MASINRMKKNFVTPALIAASLLYNSCATNPVSKKKEVVFMSEAQEIAMGKEADPQIISQYGLYENQALQDFINEKGKQMAAISHRPKLEYNFRIVDSEVLNAFAIPGGYVYFTRGIMAYLNNEAQFAGVLGHEIGHIAARHSVEQQRNQILGQAGIIAGVVLVPDLAPLAETASQGLGLLFLKFGRNAEREADKLGVEYSSKISYNATEMAGFFKTLERQSAQSGQEELPTFLSTHPNPGDRYTTVNKLATEWKQKLNLSNPQINRNAYLKRIEGLIYGEDPKQGYLENSVFYHPVLKFQFSIPAGWQYQNTPAQVQLAPKDGKALMMMTMAKGSSLNEAASAFLQQNNLKAGDTKELTVNGLPALAVTADPIPQEGQQAQAIRTLSYFIKYGDGIYLLMGVSATNDFNIYQPMFTGTQQSFKELTDAEKINKKPERVQLKTVRTAGTLEQAFRENNVDEKRFEDFAILNGMDLKDHVDKGTLLKVIER
jgi:predicted Zn-dependent protease